MKCLKEIFFISLAAAVLSALIFPGAAISAEKNNYQGFNSCSSNYDEESGIIQEYQA